MRVTDNASVVRDLALEDFDGCWIAQDGGSFSLHRNSGSSTSSLTISSEDALWIIDTLGLDASLSISRRRVVLWKQ
jgi:hypothetical protein